ncbi:hypothetical protein [Vibrio cholerae]|uniref:hypothetical protein n=1 Tax=Vibrio cholerae TaxID=666 RepID=UPI003966C6DA
MNYDEVSASKYLNNLASNVVFEPDGNVAPDFTYDNVAVEVRRLNQSHNNNGLEIARNKLVGTLRTVLKRFKNTNLSSYKLGLRFKRPIGKSKLIRNKFLTELQNLASNPQAGTSFNVAKNVSIRLIKEEPDGKSKHAFLIESDLDSGGWVVSDYISEIQRYITEKNNKIQNNLHKYRQWELVLVDHLGGLNDPGEIAEVQQYAYSLGSFTSVHIIKQDGSLLLKI